MEGLPKESGVKTTSTYEENVAIVWGGYSSEIVISEKSAAGIYTFLDTGKYNLFKVKLTATPGRWSTRGIASR